jgi:hypothetical protein
MKKLLLVPVLALALLALLAAPALASPKTIIVKPSGSDDTAAIQAAFNAAVKAGPGSIVQLSAGQFYINTVFVKDFRGTFQGAGEGKTVIDTVGTLPVNTAIEPWPFIIGFQGGSVSVCGMSFNITAPSPGESWYMWGSASTALGADVLLTGSASSAFDQVSFTDGAGDYNGYDVADDIVITGSQVYSTDPESLGAPIALAPTGGCDSVSRCSFTGDAGIWVDGLTAGRMTVGGCAAQQNVFNDFAAGCYFFDNSNSDIAVSCNRMQCSSGGSIFLYQSWSNPLTPPPPLPAPRYLITDNYMLATGAANGMWLEDDSLWNGDTPRLDATIADNTIVLDNGGGDAGIDGFMVPGILVLHNHISGTGLAGIDVGTDWYLPFDEPASGWQIIDNDVSGVTPSNAVWGQPLAQIWLGPDANHCLVVGGCRPTQVLDQGTDDTLINVTQLPLPASASAAAAVPMNSPKQLKQLKGMMLP